MPRPQAFSTPSLINNESQYSSKRSPCGGACWRLAEYPMKMLSRNIATVVGLVLLGFAAVIAFRAEASIVIAGTRVIYQSSDAEVTVRITNNGDAASLVQAWIDNGDPVQNASEIKVPFVVTPAVSRVDPGRGQNLRIFHTNEAMPQGKESIYWLNVLDIPPKAAADASDINTLQLAIRTRIKMFYRPADLAGRADTAHESLKWRLRKDRQGQLVEVSNPSVYYVSLIEITLDNGGSDSSSAEEVDMVGPGETKAFRLPAGFTVGRRATIEYRAINDYGSPYAGKATLIEP